MCGYGTALNENSGVCEIACPASRRMLDAQAVGEAEEGGAAASLDTQADAVATEVKDAAGPRAAVTAAELAALLQAAPAEPSAASAMAALALLVEDPQKGPELLAAALTTMDDATRSVLADSLFRRPSLA